MELSIGHHSIVITKHDRLVCLILPVHSSCIRPTTAGAIHGTCPSRTNAETTESPARMAADAVAAHSRTDSACARANCDSHRRLECAHYCTHVRRAFWRSPEWPHRGPDDRRRPPADARHCSTTPSGTVYSGRVAATALCTPDKWCSCRRDAART